MPSEKRERKDDDDGEQGATTAATTTTRRPEDDEDDPPSTSKKRIRSSNRSSSNTFMSSQHYHVSLMHADTVTAVVTSIKHGFVTTASSDGIVKFWKRLKVVHPHSNDPTASAVHRQKGQQQSYPCLEFVKSFTAHAGSIQALAMDPEGDVACSVGATDQLLKFYDIATFDVLTMISSPHPLGSACCCVGRGIGHRSSLSWAVSSGHASSGSIYIFSSDTASLLTILTLHGNNPITHFMAFPNHHCAVSIDFKGIVEVWSTTSTDDLGKPCTKALNGTLYDSKMDTDLYELVKRKLFAYAVAASPNGHSFAIYCSDGIIRIYNRATGKIVTKLDERLQVYQNQLQKGRLLQMDELEYGRRAALEGDILQDLSNQLHHRPSNDTAAVTSHHHNQRLTMEFDPSGHYLIIPTMIGIKVIDWQHRRLQSLIGPADASQLRFISVCLAYGDAKINQQMELARQSHAAALLAASSSSSSTAKDDQTPPPVLDDTLLIALAYQTQRLYVFSHVDPLQQSPAVEGTPIILLADAAAQRDVWNEAPSAQDRLLAEAFQAKRKARQLPTKAVLRTTLGDIHIQLFANQVPKTIENFSGHAKSGYYDNVTFHRIIKGFMLQTGDPLGDGTGGESIWGGTHFPRR